MKSHLLRHAGALLSAFLPCVFFTPAFADTVDNRKAATLNGYLAAPSPNPDQADPGNRFMGRAACALAAYQTNTQLAQADAYIESLHDEPDLAIPHNNVFLDPKEIPGFFPAPLLTRICLDPVLRSRMSAAASAKLLELMYWFIDCRSVFADAAPDKLWKITYTENHNAIRKTTYMLVAQALMGAPGYGPDFVLADGRTIREHYLAWNTYWKEFLRQAAKEGLQAEVASPQYEKYTVACWYNVRDYAADPVTRAQADQFLTLYWADVAHDFLPGATIRGGAGLRMYQNNYLTQGVTYSFRPWLHMYNWHDTAPAETPHPMILCAATSSYTPPDIVRAIAVNESNSKTPYLYSSVRWGNQSGAATDTVTFPSNIRRDTWWTPDYVMGSMTYDSTCTYARIASQSRFFTIAFNTGANDRLVIKAWGTHGNLADFWGITGACHRNVLLVARDLDSSDTDSYFSSTRLFLGGSLAANQTTDASGWIFSHSGNGYAGIWVAAGGYTWDTASTPDGKYLDLTDSWSPVLVQCGRAADYADFDAFKAALVANPPVYDSGSGILSYTSPEGDTFEIARQSAALPKINGAARPQNPAQNYSSPWLNATADTDAMTISYPGHADLKLDFGYTGTLAEYEPVTTHVTAAQNLRNTDGATWSPASGARAYSSDALLSPASGAAYAGPEFFGGFEALSTASGAFSLAQIRNATPDALRVQYTTNAAGNSGFSVLFAMPLSASTPLSSLVVSGSAGRGSGSGNGGSLHVAVKIGQDWYVNNAPVPLGTSQAYAFQNLASGTWAAYAPATSLHFPGNGTTSLAATAVVTDAAVIANATWTTATGPSAKVVDIMAFKATGEPLPAAAPLITSGTTASAIVGEAFTYTITADNSPASFAAAGLPAGLFVNTNTGVISGIPEADGTFSITLTATNAAGPSAPVTLALTIAPAPGTVTLAHFDSGAYVTSNQNLSNIDGTEWSAVAGPRAYSGAAPLSPASNAAYTGPEFFGGFEALSASLGAFSQAIVRNVTPSDGPRVQFTTNDTGAGGFSFLFAMPLSEPATLSTLVVSGTAGRATSSGGYLYVAVKIGQEWYVNNTAIPFGTGQSYTFDTLDSGTWAAYAPATSLHFPGNGTTSLAAAAAVTDVALLAHANWTAATVSGVNKFVDVTAFKVVGVPGLSAVAPVITSGTTASATVGAPFTYTITASHSPASFAAAGLPAGLSVDTNTGVISGAPETSGIFNITLTASNAAGTGAPVTLVLTINPASSLITLAEYEAVATYVTANQNLRNTDGSAWAATSGPRPYSGTAPLSPVIGANYTGPEFFGGFEPLATAAGSITAAQIRNSTTDAPRIQFKTSASGAGAFSVLFAMPLSTAAPLSSLAVSGTANRSSNSGGALYVAVRIGADWYINNTSVPYGTSQQYTFQNLGDATWAAYVPTDSLHFPGAGAIALDASASVTEVALLATVTWTEATSAGTDKIADIIAFKVMGTPAAASTAPVITSATTASATLGSAFTYLITADNSPSGFTATGLPDGLFFNAVSGIISGAPSITGSFAIAIGAYNDIGSDSAQLDLRVTAGQSAIDTVVPPGTLGSPASTAIDSAGNSYVADVASGTIKKVAPDGAVSTFATIPQPAVLAKDSDGNFYAAGNDGNVCKILADGTVVSPPLATGITTPGGIAVAPDGTVYVSKTDANTIVKITPAGVVSTLAGSGVAGSSDSATGSAATFNAPTGLALNTATNTLYVADTVNCAIREINLATGAVATVAGQPGIPGDTGSAGINGKAADGTLNTPEAIAIDKAGLLYIADTGNNLIRGFDPVTGALITLAGDTGATSLDAPAGLAFNPAGLLYVADTGNGALRTITIKPVIAAKFADRTIALGNGDSVTLDGTAWASPAAEYSWTRNNTPLPIGTAATITISPSSVADSGAYAVAAANLAGASSASMNLTVIDPNGARYYSDSHGAGAPGLWLLAGMTLLLLIRKLTSRRCCP